MRIRNYLEFSVFTFFVWNKNNLKFVIIWDHANITHQHTVKNGILQGQSYIRLKDFLLDETIN